MQVELELRMKSLFARDKNTRNKKKKKNHQWSSRLQAVCKMGATFVSTGIGEDRAGLWIGGVYCVHMFIERTVVKWVYYTEGRKSDYFSSA